MGARVQSQAFFTAFSAVGEARGPWVQTSDHKVIAAPNIPTTPNPPVSLRERALELWASAASFSGVYCSRMLGAGCRVQGIREQGLGFKV